MNADRINLVADAIEGHTLDLGFNMNFFRMNMGTMPMHGPYEWDKSGHQCGTVACIAGWTAALMGEPHADFSQVGIWLGLADSRPEAEYSMANGGPLDQLFFACDLTSNGSGVRLTSISQERAVATLRHLAETGVVDWTASEGVKS